MLNERRDGRTHPFVQRQSAQESVKFRLAAGAIEAKDRCAAGADGGLPEPDEVPLARQRICRGSFRPLAIFDLGLGNAVWDIHFELYEKLPHRLLLLLIHTRLGCHSEAVANQPLDKPPG